MPPPLPSELTARLEALTSTAAGADAAAALAAADEAWSLLPDPKIAHEPWSIRIPRAAVEAAERTGDHYTAWLWLSRGQAAADRLGDGAARAALDRAEDAIHRAVERGDEGSGPLAEATCVRVDELAEQGNAALEAEDWRGALRAWRAALELVPEPRTDHTESLWLYASIGDAYHSGERWRDGIDALQEALKCPGGLGNGYVWLRLGQCWSELGDEARAIDGLLSAYLLEGEEILADEEGWDLLVRRGLTAG